MGNLWISDTEDIYRWWCIVAGHRWRRIAYTLHWVKPRSCHRCEDIRPPWPPSRQPRRQP